MTMHAWSPLGECNYKNPSHQLIKQQLAINYLLISELVHVCVFVPWFDREPIS